VSAPIPTGAAAEDAMWAVEVRWPADELALNPSLVCMWCNTALCEVEHGDAVQVLINVVNDHVCTGRPALDEGDPE
jgi:hypothetical protein